MDLLFKLAIVILVGCLAGKLAKTVKLSNIFGYLIAGLVLGPSFLKLISSQDLTSLRLIGDVALAIVAFKIGSEFVLKDMKKLGKAFLIITFAEVMGAIFVVFFILYFLSKGDLVFSLIMASISAATAPAATIMVMRQYRSDGPVTRTLLPVTALDGVLGVALFGVAISVARMYVVAGEMTTWQMIGRPLVEILGSLALGVVLGLALTLLSKRAGDSDELLIITLALILVSTSVARLMGLSPLLANIMMGAALTNLTQNTNRVFFSLSHFTPPIYLLFFTLAGASLDLGVLMGAALLGLAYLVARATGKMLGAWLGAKGSGAEPTVRRYLGVALLPQGGISVALAVLVRYHFPEISTAVTAIIVSSVLLYEIAGPTLAKTAIEKAGEIGGMGRQIDTV